MYNIPVMSLARNGMAEFLKFCVPDFECKSEG
jgi:hypothetical protein